MKLIDALKTINCENLPTAIDIIKNWGSIDVSLFKPVVDKDNDRLFLFISGYAIFHAKRTYKRGSFFIVVDNMNQNVWAQNNERLGSCPLAILKVVVME